MEEVTFNSLEELYTRLKPALRTKKMEMKRHGFSYIKEEDIWNYLKETKWQKDRDLFLHQMVDDILNVDNNLVEDYLRSKLNLEKRSLYFNQ